MPSATSASNAGTETTGTQRTAVDDLIHGTLTETEVDGEAVKTAVLHTLYRHHPAVSLEDVLELNVLVAAPEPGPLEERVAAVLAEAVTQHDSWMDTANTTGQRECF